MPRHLRVVAGFLSLRARFYPGPVEVDFMVENLTMGQMFLTGLLRPKLVAKNRIIMK